MTLFKGYQHGFEDSMRKLLREINQKMYDLIYYIGQPTKTQVTY